METGKTNWKSHLVFTLRIIILIKIFLVAEPVVAQGRLSAVRNEVRQPKEEPKEERKRPKSTHREDDHHHHDHDHDRRRRRRRRGGQFHGINFFDCSPPPQVIHTREIHVIDPVPFAPAPVLPPTNTNSYQSVVVPDSQPILPEPIIEDVVFEPSFHNWGARITGWYGGGVDGISQGNLGVLFQSPGGIGLDGSVRTVREQGFSDHLWLGDLNLVFEPICSDHLRLRVGVGLNWLADSWGGDAGFNLTTGFDAPLSDRLILGGEVDLGNLGHSDFLHAQLSLGYQLENAEFVVGYDHTNIGSVDLNSPFVGLRFRF